MIVSVIVVLAFFFSLFAMSRLMGVSPRAASTFMALSATFGLATFSALTVIPQISTQALSALPAGFQVAITPLVFMMELLAGTFCASSVLRQDPFRFLKLSIATVLVTLVISIPICLALVCKTC